jgi:hypothetical protein
MSIETSGELNAVLIGAVTKTVDAVETAAGFLAAQAPDVIEQLLMWHLVSSLLLCVTGIVVLYVLQRVLRSCTGKGARVDPDDAYHYGYKQTLTHDGKGNQCPRIIGTVIASIIVLTIGINLITGNMDWLKIFVAEKIWLMEYATDMVKKVK